MIAIFIKLLALPLLLAASAAAMAQEGGTVFPDDLAIATFDPAAFSQQTTGCDHLAAHDLDPWSVAPGVARSAIDFARAIPACEAAVARDPGNPRLRYQLGRLYGYSGEGAKAMEHRIAAVAAGYPQALFVVGYILLEGMNITQDTCKGAALILRSAEAGRLAGLVGYPSWALDGRFEGCDVDTSTATLTGFLDRAAAADSGFHHQLLVGNLRARLAARD